MATMTTKPEITAENLAAAASAITKFASSRKMEITNGIPTGAPTFPSKSKTKEFQVALGRVLDHPGIRSCNFYLRKLSKAVNQEKASKVDYSSEERDIQAARKVWKVLKAKAEEARLAYKEIKSDFYK